MGSEMCIRDSPEQQTALTALATDLAADKVVFGKDRAPLEQAVEAIKAVRGTGG